MRRLAGIAIIAVLALAGCGGGDQSPTEGGSTPGPPARTRIASVRVYQHGTWTVPGETPDTVGKALAALKPTLVTNLIRFEPTEEVKNHEVDAWNKIRARVLAASPDAHFGVELDGLAYKSADQVEQQMAEIRSKLDNNGWFLDFFTSAYKQRPEVIEAAIQSAHANGEWIGGNVFGLSHHPDIPPGSDYLAAQDSGNFKLDLNAVRELAERIPVAVHVGNSPGDASSPGCRFLKQLETAEREGYVTLRAKQQTANDFRFAYPVLFPECDFQPPKGLISFDAIRDGSMLPTIKRLMDRYDSESN
jgi:hypothetical protein